MIDKPQIIQTAAQPAAVIHIKTPRAEMGNLFGRSGEESRPNGMADRTQPAAGALVIAYTVKGYKHER